MTYRIEHHPTYNPRFAVHIWRNWAIWFYHFSEWRWRHKERQWGVRSYSSQTTIVTPWIVVSIWESA